MKLDKNQKPEEGPRGRRQQEKGTGVKETGGKRKKEGLGKSFAMKKDFRKNRLRGEKCTTVTLWKSCEKGPGDFPGDQLGGEKGLGRREGTLEMNSKKKKEVQGGERS